MADQKNAQYYREREAAERARAARTRDAKAEKLHLELADQYARVAAAEENLQLARQARGPTFIVGEDDVEGQKPG